MGDASDWCNKQVGGTDAQPRKIHAAFKQILVPWPRAGGARAQVPAQLQVALAAVQRCLPAARRSRLRRTRSPAIMAAPKGA